MQFYSRLFMQFYSRLFMQFYSRLFMQFYSRFFMHFYSRFFMQFYSRFFMQFYSTRRWFLVITGQHVFAIWNCKISAKCLCQSLIFNHSQLIQHFFRSPQGTFLAFFFFWWLGIQYYSSEEIENVKSWWHMDEQTEAGHLSISKNVNCLKTEILRCNVHVCP
jgi:hypothetical protein